MSSDAATARIRRRAAAVRREELQRATHRLEARGELTDDQRAAVEALADGVIERLLAVPERRLAAADEETTETARQLFS